LQTEAGLVPRRGVEPFIGLDGTDVRELLSQESCERGRPGKKEVDLSLAYLALAVKDRVAYGAGHPMGVIRGDALQ
jgi:hypothetical protein